MNVIAIIAAYNEADIIGPAIRHLCEEGVEVYLIDNCSTDGTRAAAEPFLGDGLLGVEQFPRRDDVSRQNVFAWRALLRRKEELATELAADWFIHHDADEFRESPWTGARLVDAIARVDAAGYNAIDFELLNFRPTDDGFVPGTDPRPAMQMYERGASWDKLQVKCWKKTSAVVDLTSSGGHDVQFENRRVFPVRFLLRHYPIRNQAHGLRKVFHERFPRLDPEERAAGWHVQYDALGEDHDFVVPAETLLEYDADSVRLGLILHHRAVEDLETALRRAHERLRAAPAPDPDSADIAQLVLDAIDAREQRLAELESANAALDSELQKGEQELQTKERELQTKERELQTTRENAEAQVQELLAWSRQLESARHDVQRRLDAMHQSLTWRWTAPLRSIAGWLLRSPR